MVEVFDRVYVGNATDFFREEDNKNFSFCLCAKTFHKMFAKLDGCEFEGYDGNMNKNESEYLIAERLERNVLAVNLIDTASDKYIADEIIDKCMDYIISTLEYSPQTKVLICCDQGMSRSASVAFMYGIVTGYFDKCDTYIEALNDMKMLYPYMEQGKGFATYTQKFWNKHREEM